MKDRYNKKKKKSQEVKRKVRKVESCRKRGTKKNKRHVNKKNEDEKES
jgi:hypothetical protein